MKEMSAMKEMRTNPRVDASVSVLVAVPNQPPMSMKTGNMTGNGLFLISRNQKLPDIGTEIVLTMEEMLQSTEPTAMVGKVIHKNEQGMGVELLGPLS